MHLVKRSAAGPRGIQSAAALLGTAVVLAIASALFARARGQREAARGQPGKKPPTYLGKEGV